jgi:hypothetical protein
LSHRQISAKSFARCERSVSVAKPRLRCVLDSASVSWVHWSGVIAVCAWTPYCGC